MGNKESMEYSSRVEYVQPGSFHVGSSVDPSDRNKQHSQLIADNFTSLDQVISALRDAGLESSNLILGIDFTKSNEWTGKYSFHRRSLHAIGGQPNPYEQAISIIGRTLSPFDEDNMIPCFGFGDASTHDQYVFSFFPDHHYCNGFEEALARYREIVPHLKLSGPTSFAPIINASIDIVVRSNGQYHVLVIIADGQVSGNSESVTRPGALSPQEQETINAVVTASQYPLSIILVGVGDGPWDAMQQFDDNIPQRSFDNFQFVNFTKIMSENTEMSKKEAAFALAALMEIPLQYRATQNPQFQRRRTDKIRGSPPLPPPREVIAHDNAVSAFPHTTSIKSTMQNLSTEHHTMSFQSMLPNIPTEQVCPICLTNPKNMAFGCGHLTCKDCGTPSLFADGLALVKGS
ncbi:E3 ubiquitin-protein ligase RGLG1 [Cinnamomum micranthum f. kanehirae]|uniref:E3 ubiquitin-protein ligase RGLG1 n=1 Tax=Cinnamomum micranthum f. kanehirae TaxID=337451 RepID=A0A443PHG9_9MAGN|nr:E3 ubiquitin-protein ligase RGLG1 [Cinnamomum micranthum f. kanehirae]